MALKYTGPTQGTGPPNRKMTKYTGPTQDTKDDRFYHLLGGASSLGGTSVLSHFILLSGTNSILRTFLGGTIWKNHPV